MIRAFVQARMSSRRFPGKVLAPFRGQPLIWHVLRAVQEALPEIPITVLTSTDPSDDPLAAYLSAQAMPVFRGPLDNVFERMCGGLLEYPCDWVLRVSADSPLLDARVLRAVVHHPQRDQCDLVTTIFPRTFPKGQNAELIRVGTLLQLGPATLSAEEQEHVTSVLYHHPERFRIVNVESGDPALAHMRLAVDTVEDLQRLEQLSDTAVHQCLSNLVLVTGG